MPTDQLGQWSPDGSAYACPGHTDRAEKTGADGIWVQDIPSGERRWLDLPTDLSFSLAAWESPDAVVLEARLPFDGNDDQQSGLQALVRCDAGTGSCERVTGAPTGVPVLPY